MEALRYAVKAGGGGVVNLGLLWVFVEVWGLHALLAPVLSMAIVLTGGFVVADTWVYRHGQARDARSILTRAAGYYSTLVATKLGNYVIYAVLVWTGMFYLVAWIVGAGAMFVVSYAITHLIWTRSSATL